MPTNDQIIIEFTSHQQRKIALNCGFDSNPMVTTSLSLIMLSMAATTFESKSLPLVKSIASAHQILNQERNCSNPKTLYTYSINLTKKQSQLIAGIVKKEWSKITILPDEYDISFTQCWNKPTKPKYIGKSFVIIPDNIPYKSLPAQIIVKLPYSTTEKIYSFGTGSHPTTKATLILLENHLIYGKRVLDVGTGSGILAMAAAKLGATIVLGIDINSGSVITAEKTVKLNNLESIVQIQEGSIESVNHQYDVVVANLFPKIIVSMAPSFYKKINANGILIVSGIVVARMKEMISVLSNVGFVYLESTVVDHWCGIAFKKS